MNRRAHIKRLAYIAAVCAFLHCNVVYARGRGGSGCNTNDLATVQEQTQLSWGTLAIPSSGTETYTVKGTGGGDSGSGTLLFGNTVRGKYRIARTVSEGRGCRITIDIQNISSGNPNVTLSDVTAKYAGDNLSGNPPWAGLRAPGWGETLYLGFTATYNNGVPAGSLSPTFDIVVQYDSPANPGTTTANQTAALSFDNALSIDNVRDIDFGVVKADTAGTYVIDTTGTVTPSGGGVVFGGTPTAGSMTIHGSASQAIDISAGSYVDAGIGGGVMLSSATCSYNGGAEVSCNDLSTQTPPGSSGKVLKLGVKARVDANQTAGTQASPSFTVTVAYQ